MIAVLAVGIFLLGRFIPDPTLYESIKRGKEAYFLNCQDCHMEDGIGTPEINLPMAKADYLKKPAKTLIGIILKG